MSSTGYMAAVADKRVEELLVCDWDEAIAQCGVGDEVADSAFFLELLTCFFTDGKARLARLLEMARIWRAGGEIGPYSPQNPSARGGTSLPARSLEVAVREEAHALKGSAANVRLWRLAKAAENIELPFKELISHDTPDQGERQRLLEWLFTPPSVPLLALYREFRRIMQFVEEEARPRAEGLGADLASELPDDTWPQLRDDGNVASFDQEFSVFSDVLTPTAGAQVAGQRLQEGGGQGASLGGQQAAVGQPLVSPTGGTAATAAAAGKGGAGSQGTIGPSGAAEAAGTVQQHRGQKSQEDALGGVDDSRVLPSNAAGDVPSSGRKGGVQVDGSTGSGSGVSSGTAEGQGAVFQHGGNLTSQPPQAGNQQPFRSQEEEQQIAAGSAASSADEVKPDCSMV